MIQTFQPEIIVVAAGFDAMGGEKPYGLTKLTQFWYGWCIASLKEMSLPLMLNLEGGYKTANVVACVEQVLIALKGTKQSGDFSLDMQRAHIAACGDQIFQPKAAHIRRMLEAMETRNEAIESSRFELHVCR